MRRLRRHPAPIAALALTIAIAVAITPNLRMAGAAVAAARGATHASSAADAKPKHKTPHVRGRGADNLDAVRRVARLRTKELRVATGDATGTACLNGNTPPADGCVVAQLQPQLTAPSACTGLSGEFDVQVGSANPSNLVAYTYPFTAGSSSSVPTTLVTDGQSGQTYQWLFKPTTTTTACYDSSSPVWRTFRIDMVRAGIEATDSLGPVTVGLSSGALMTSVSSTPVKLVGGQVSIGLAYRSPGGVGYQTQEPTNTLPSGWAYTGLNGLAPWITLSQVGTGSVPAAVVLTAFDGQQLEFTNTLAGTGAKGGAWAPPTQSGWPQGQFGTLTDSGDLTASNATFTWSSGQQVLTFARTGSGTWGVSTSKQVESGGYDGVAVQPTWDPSVSPPRLAGLTDPVSGKKASFVYGNGSSCDGVTPPTDGSDVYYAPTGMLCAWTTFDGSTTHVWYVLTGSDCYQVGWVAGSGGSNTQLFWATDGGSCSDDELVGMQTPSGYDAQGSVSTLTEADTTWTINYDPLGNVSSIVSPLPGVSSFVSGVSNDREGHVYGYETSSQGQQWTTISRAVIANNADPTDVVAGASLIEEVLYDAAWRASTTKRKASTGATWVASQTWDTVHDRQIGREERNGRMTALEYDYLGRVTDEWGPAPAADFAVNAAGTGMAPVQGFGDNNVLHSQSTYDADAENKLTGWTASFFSGSTPAGVPASTVGSCSDGQCPGATASPLDWTTLPSGANVTGAGWSMQLTATVEAPEPGASGLQYRVSSDGNGSATLWANGMCTTSTTSTSCGTGNTAAAPASTSQGEPVTLSVQYVRKNGASVSSSAPATVTVQQSTDGGSTWTTLTAPDLDPGFGLTSSTKQNDTLSSGGPTETLGSAATYSDPEFQQVGKATTTGGSGLSTSSQETYEDYNGTNQWGRTLTMTRPGGGTLAASYYGDTASTTNPCTKTTSAVQAGLQKAFTGVNGSDGSATGDTTAVTYDASGRQVAFSHTSADGTANELLCLAYDARGEPISASSGDGSLKVTMAYPWDDPASTDPFTGTTTFVAPVPGGSPSTFTKSVTVDLLGRAVETVDQWGTTTTTDFSLNASTGVVTVTNTITAGSYVVTDTSVINSDGTLATRTRHDSGGTTIATYAYNDDGTIDTISLASGNTTLVTETLGYDPTTGVVTSATWKQGTTTRASSTIGLAPNSLRRLSDTSTVAGVDYTWKYSYDGLTRLSQALLSSSNSSVSGSWTYTFAPDTSAAAGENPNAYLDGDITTKTTILNGGAPSTVDYHYDHNDRLTRTTDPAITNLAYDSFGDMTKVGADTITYNDRNAPIEVSDGKNTVGYTRLLHNQIIAKTTTTAAGTATIRYSADGLLLSATNVPQTQVVSFGPVIATFAIGSGAAEYQINTLAGHQLLTLSSTGTPTTTTPALFDPYGSQIQPPTPTAPATTTPAYGWHASTARETENVALPFVMLGARLYIPSLALFSSPDPVPGGALTPYNYANSDPIDFADPSGNSSKAWHAFTHWWKHDFVSFWTKDIPHAWDWCFSSGEPGWHKAIGIVVIVIVVVVIVAAVVVLTLATGGADLVVGAEVGADVAAGAGAAEAGAGVGAGAAEAGSSVAVSEAAGVASGSQAASVVATGSESVAVAGDASGASAVPGIEGANVVDTLGQGADDAAVGDFPAEANPGPAFNAYVGDVGPNLVDTMGQALPDVAPAIENIAPEGQITDYI